MRKHRWSRIKKIEEDDMSKLRINELFLAGDAVVAQLESKNVGDNITYYKVIKKQGNNIEYIPVFDILEEDD